MHYQNKRLAHAREILSGLERRMGLSSVDDIHAFDTGLLRGGEVYCANGSVGQMMRAVSRALSESQWCAYWDTRSGVVGCCTGGVSI